MRQNFRRYDYLEGVGVDMQWIFSLFILHTYWHSHAPINILSHIFSSSFNKLNPFLDIPLYFYIFLMINKRSNPMWFIPINPMYLYPFTIFSKKIQSIHVFLSIFNVFISISIYSHSFEPLRKKFLSLVKSYRQQLYFKSNSHRK